MPEAAKVDTRSAAADAGPIRFFDLETPKQRLRADIEKRWQKVLDHGAFIGGPEVAELETALAAYVGAKHGLAVASGTDSLVIALMAEDLNAGDAVFLPGFTYNASANAILVAGPTPIFVDVDAHTCNIDVEHLEAQIDAVVREGRLKPRMVIAVDLYGLPADYVAINRIAKKHGMLVLADAAQSFGRMKAFHGQMGMFIRALTYMLSHGADGLRQVADDAVLNANYILASLKDVMTAPFPGHCMHEALFDDRFLADTSVTTLDFAKALLDRGYHPMTMYFPLVVHGAFLIEPTETESKETLDAFIATMRDLAAAAKRGDAEQFHQSPRLTPRRRLDETQAARQPILRWKEV